MKNFVIKIMTNVICWSVKSVYMPDNVKNVLNVVQISKVSYIRNNNDNLKVNIPANVKNMLGLQYGDRVVWYVLEDQTTKQRYAAFRKVSLKELLSFP